MNEGIYTRDKGRPQKRVEPEKNPKKKSHARKLKNDTTRSEAMRKKLRTKKADTKETAEEVKKTKKLHHQGRKKTFADVASTRQVHHQVSEANEDNNAGVDALNSGTELAENGIYQAKAKGGKSEKLHGRKTADGTAEKSSKEVQKNLMKKEIQRNAYRAQAAENANAFGSVTKRFTDKAEDMAGRLAEAVKEFMEEHPLGLVIALIVLIVVLVLSGTLSSCSMMAGGSNNMVIATSFTAQDADIIAVENDYKSLESDLQTKVNNIESDYPGYDEYRYSLSEISHNPFELAALLTVLYEDYTQAEVQEKLQTIFDYQYKLTTQRIVETRTRTETRTGCYTDEAGVNHYYTYDVEVEYEYYILQVTLTNNGIQAAVNALNLSEEQLQRYSVLLEMRGNKPDIFGDNPYANPSVNPEYEDYAVPGEYMTDQQFANMLNEAKKYLGYPYVWGGSSPSTSFDCSGFVSYVINHCGNGWNYGRLTADGWKNATARVSASDVKPGDLIFFQGTYETSGASHVGIVVDPVNKIMIHCGNPIQFASYDSNYWRQHFYCYGRIQ